MHRLGLVFLLTGSLATAGEYAVLTSGARLHIERHEANGAKVRMYHGEGFVEMDATAVQAFEADERPPAPPPVPVTNTPVEPQPVAPKTVNPLELADAAADKYGLPRSLVRSVMATESGYQIEAVSPKGAIGLMQLMPETAQQLGADPYDPSQNVDAGTRYLRALLEKYDGRLWHALAAYNAGSGAVEKYQGIPPYRETIQYIGTIQRKMEKAEGGGR